MTAKRTAAWLLAASTAVASSLAVPGEARDAHKSTCNPPGSKTLAKSRSGRVYTRDKVEPEDAAVACLFGSGVRRPLSRGTFNPQALGPFATRGGYVAYLARFCLDELEGGCDFEVLVMDVRTGRYRHKTFNKVDQRPCAFEEDCGEPAAAKIVVKANGSVAWVACDDFDGGCSRPNNNPPHRVIRLDSRGKRLLDESSDIRTHSLRLSSDRRRVAWRHGDTRHTASLR